MIDATVDWSAVEWVMLDMDGTVLDLAFDNYFWSELLPERYAAYRGMSVAQARADLAPVFVAERGRLNWYCLDFWSARTGLDLAVLKHEVRDRINPLPHSVSFLHAVRASGRQLWLVTNAHAGSWHLKMEQTGLGPCFDRIVCAHDHGAPKEQPAFWHRLAADAPFDPDRTLFVDDSLSVLAAARDYGIRQLVAIRRPDSGQPRRTVTEFPSVESLADLQLADRPDRGIASTG